MANPAMDDVALGVALVAEPRWQTVVLEAVDAINRRGEEYKTFQGHVKAAVEWFRKKAPDGSASPRDKAIAAAITLTTATTGVGAGVRLTNWITNDALKVPVVLTMPAGNESVLHVSVKPPDGEVPIRLAIQPEGGATIPVEITTKPQAATLQLSLADIQILERIQRTINTLITVTQTNNIKNSNVLANGIPAELQAIRRAIGDLQPESKISAAELQPAVDALTNIATALKTQTQPAGLHELADQLVQTGNAINRLRGLAASGRTLVTTAAVENSHPTIRVDWPNSTGGVETCELTMSIGRIRRTVEVTGLSVKCGDAVQVVPLGGQLRELRVGDVLRAGNHALTLTVDSIDRPFFGANSAILRVVSGVVADQAPAPNLLRTATQEQR